MRERLKIEEQDWPASICRRRIVGTIHGSFAPFCGKEDVDYPVDSSSTANKSLGSYVARSSFMKDEKPYWWREGFCRSLRKDTTLRADEVVIRKHIVSSETDPDSGCGPLDFRHTDYDLIDETSLRFPMPTGWLSALPRIEDPILLLESEGFKDGIRELDLQALGRLVPDISKGFDIDVFLFELKDLRGMVMGAFKKLSQLKHAGRVPDVDPTVLDPHGSATVDVPRGTVDELLNSLSGSSSDYLANVFGWIPFVKDCVTIFERINALADDFNKFQQTIGKKRSFHMSKRLGVSKPGTPGSSQIQAESFDEQAYYSDEDSDTNPLYFARDIVSSFHPTVRTHVSLGPMKYHATIKYVLSVDVPDSILYACYAFQRFGAGISIADLWTVTPFSFMLDWFLDVGSYLRQFDPKALKVTATVTDFSRSVQYKSKATVQLTDVRYLSFADSPFHNVMDDGWELTGTADLGYETLVGYWRMPGVSWSAEELKTIEGGTGISSKFRASIVFALGAQKTRRKKKKVKIWRGR